MIDSTAERAGSEGEDRLAALTRRRRRFLSGAWAAIGAALLMALLGEALAPFGDALTGLAALIAAALGVLASRTGQQERSLAAERAEAAADAQTAGAESRRELLRAQRRAARDAAMSAEGWGVLFLAAGAMTMIWFVTSAMDFMEVYAAQEREQWWIEAYEYEVVGQGLIAFVLLGWAVTRFLESVAARRDAARYEVELELAQVSDPISRARKMFLLNEQTLQKYYRANRRNNIAALGLSAACVAAGVGVTVWTISLVVGPDTGGGDWVAAAIGAANAVMINVVAAVLVRMQTSIWSNVNAFHGRLVRTHEVFLAGVLAAEIDDPEIRRQTLAAVARGLGGARAEPKPAKNDAAD